MPLKPKVDRVGWAIITVAVALLILGVVLLLMSMYGYMAPLTGV